MHHPRFPTLKLLLLLPLAAACSSGMLARNPVASAIATLVGPNGAPMGTAVIRQAANGEVTVDVHAIGLTEGAHGIHFHAVGLCEGGSAFASAGAHYNPLSKEHGLQSPGGPHAGDAPNIVAGTGGAANASIITDRVTLTPGTTSLLDADGSAVVIHAAPDDQVTQPAGNSGGRVACGVVRSTP